MAQTRVNFGEWLPDQPGVIGALTNAKNCYPRAVGYGPFPEEANYSQDAGQDINNVVAARANDGTTSVFASGTSKIYKLNGSTLTFGDVTGNTLSNTERIRFTQFGSKLIAASGANTLRGYDLNSSVTFSDLAVDAPPAKYVTVVRDFVVTGFQSSYPSRAQWSGINNETTWTASATTQADYQDIPDGGIIQGVTGGEFGLILLSQSIYRMSYVGTPLIFQFDNITRNLGCYEPNSVIQYQGITYFLSDDGFYSCNGQQIEAIGAEKVNRYFFTSLKEADIANMSVAVDYEKALVIWGYPSVDLTYRLLIYHVPTKRWSYAETAVDRIATSSTPAFTLEGLDSYSTSIDALLTPLDSRLFVGGKLQLAGTDGAKIIVFSGSPKTANLQTSDIDTNGQSMITLVRPIVDNGSGSAAVTSRNNLDTQVSFGSLSAADTENRIGVRSVGRFHRVSLEPTGANWSSAIGVDLEVQQGGTR